MSTSQVQTVVPAAEKFKLVLAAVLLLGSLAAYYLLAKQGPLVQWASLVGGLVLAVVVFLTATPGRDLLGFGRDAWRELGKVVWPARKEAIQMTAYVFGFVFIMALFLWLTDKTLEWAFYDLFLGWKK